MTAIERRGQGAELERTVASARDYASQSRAPATVAAYRGDWQRWVDWAAGQGLAELPAEPAAVAAYVAHLADAGRKVSTIERALVAIAQAHKLSGHPSPVDAAAREVLKGVKRAKGSAARQARPVRAVDLRRLVAACPEDIRGARDRALLTLGWSGALRRSELVALDWDDLDEAPEGLRVRIRRSKTDGEGAGAVVGVPYGSDPATCPVRAVRAWRLASSGGAAAEGPVFRRVLGAATLGERLGDRTVALALKRLAVRAGYDPEAVAALSGHSLRRGLATEAAGAGRAMHALMRHGRWRSEGMVRRYIDEGSLFAGHVAEGLL
jgi:integrase